VHFVSVQISSSTFLTGMAASPLLVSYARQVGVEIDWASWFVCAIVPSIISCVLNPWLLLKLARPQVTRAEHVQALALEQLKVFETIFFFKLNEQKKHERVHHRIWEVY